MRFHGFSVSDWLVTIAVLLVLALLAVPRWSRPTVSANEASAVATIRQAHRAEMAYSQRFPALGFADDITKLPPTGNDIPPAAAKTGLLKFFPNCATQPCERNGYLFAIDQASGAPVDTFRITAVPATAGVTGIRGFCVSSAGAVTYDSSGGKSCANPI